MVNLVRGLVGVDERVEIGYASKLCNENQQRLAFELIMFLAKKSAKGSPKIYHHQI